MAKLPNGLSAARNALAGRTDYLERLVTVVFLRQLLDEDTPTIAGHDPRSLLTPRVRWAFICADGNRAVWLDALAQRINDHLGEELLVTGWERLPAGETQRAMDGVTRWRPPTSMIGGDMLGAMLEAVRGDKAALGAFYTPYNVSLAVAVMTSPAPGESVCDPCCGSGRMLLAALEACREAHGPGARPELFGVDVDGQAVRVCKLNLFLAGYGCAEVHTADSITGKKLHRAAG